MEIVKTGTVNSKAEELFVEIFCDAFGVTKANQLFVQYPFLDINGKHRFFDFALETPHSKIAFEIDGETYHNPKNISAEKYSDDLLKQNSLVYQAWQVYRWTYNDLKNHKEQVRDNLLTFLGEHPMFKDFQLALPPQLGKAIELRDYQNEAIENLVKMRKNGETIALLYHATGVGKTITAATDAMTVGGNALFLVNRLNLADQAKEQFSKIWSEATQGDFTGKFKELGKQVTFATVQTMSSHLDKFPPEYFSYIAVDECHHATSETYQKIFSYFTPEFILGLTATPERADGEEVLTLFQNIAHKMDLETAVERGILAPIRCLRVKTDIDLSEVRIRGIRYDSSDLESKLFLPERNKLLVNTYVNNVKNKKTVIFCASVNHSEEMARLLQSEGISAQAVSGKIPHDERIKVLENYETGTISVLCACDLLNEGWDSPKTEVLFMARPTLSKTLYMQQLGRGTRKCEGKEDLLVFDFVDNANMFNMPYSLHRMLDMSQYRPLEYVLAPKEKKEGDNDLFRRGEKPTAYLDIPVNLTDYELIDLFDWQKEAKNMISQKEFVRMVNVQSETILDYLRDRKITPDLAVPMGDSRTINYYHEKTIQNYSKEFKWKMITPENMKDLFMDFVRKMTMKYSYKPVLIQSFFEHMGDDGKAKVSDIVESVMSFYQWRREQGLIVEVSGNFYLNPDLTEKAVEKHIFNQPFNRFSEMKFLLRSRDVAYIELNAHIFKKLTEDDISDIFQICEEKLECYYTKLHQKPF